MSPPRRCPARPSRRELRGWIAAMASAPWELSLSDASAAIGSGRLSPVELIDAALDRIERVEPRVQAWARVQADGARAAARRLAELRASGTILGPLHGIAVGVKDIFYTEGTETSCGSKIMAGFVPSYDATSVARLRRAGA